MFKADPNLAAEILLTHFTEILDQEKISLDWTKKVIIKILKEGVFSNCSNWRWITLLSVSSKLFYIIQRKASAVGTLTRYLFSIRIIIGQCSEWQRSLYINFIDFPGQSLEDSEGLWHSNVCCEHPSAVLTQFSCSVGASDSDSHVRVRQGRVMSASLCNLAIDCMGGDQARGIRWMSLSTLEDLYYADDIGLL